MKKLFFLFSFVILTYASDFEIIKLRDYTFPGGIFKMQYIDNTIYAVGYEFSIVSFFAKSTDLGKTWIVLTPSIFPASSGLRDLHFINKNIGFLAGSKGYIYKTTNGGDDWSLISDTLFYNNDINSINALNDSTLIVAGNYSTNIGTNVIMTTNNGKNWKVVNTNNDRTIYKLKIFSTEDIFLVGSSKTILRSYDTLKSFVQIPITGGDNSLYDIEKIDDNEYIIVGTKGNIAKSTNGGLSFIAIDTTASKQPLYSVAFKGNLGIICGSNGELYRSTDKGNNWQIVPAFTTEVLRNILFVNNEIFVGGYRSVIFKSTDNGLNWYDVSNSNRDFYSVYVENENNILAVGGSSDGTRSDGAVSSDGGKTWNKLPIVIQNTVLDGYKKGNYIVISGNKSAFYYTTNSGFNWTNKSYGNGISTYQYKMYFLNKDTGYIANSDGQIYFTTNSGNSFTTCVTAPNTKFYDIQMINKTRGFAVGTGKKIYETFDGKTFISEGLASINTDEIRGISMLDENNGYICGKSGAVYKTNNGFVDIDLISDTIKYNNILLRSIAANDNKTIWAVGVKTSTINGLKADSAIAMRYNQSTNKMEIAFTIGNIMFTRIKKLNNNSFIVSATDGKIYKIIDNTILSNENSYDEISKNIEFTLQQNYPNPFNPSTIISYTLPTTTVVKLEVYDILGKHIQTLVNDVQNAGTYKINYSANNLPSGIYIAKLTANNYTKTIKMMLLK